MAPVHVPGIVEGVPVPMPEPAKSAVVRKLHEARAHEAACMTRGADVVYAVLVHAFEAADLADAPHCGVRAVVGDSAGAQLLSQAFRGHAPRPDVVAHIRTALDARFRAEHGARVMDLSFWTECPLPAESDRISLRALCCGPRAKAKDAEPAPVVWYVRARLEVDVTVQVGADAVYRALLDRVRVGPVDARAASLLLFMRAPVINDHDVPRGLDDAVRQRMMADLGVAVKDVAVVAAPPDVWEVRVTFADAGELAKLVPAEYTEKQRLVVCDVAQRKPEPAVAKPLRCDGRARSASMAYHTGDAVPTLPEAHAFWTSHEACSILVVGDGRKATLQGARRLMRRTGRRERSEPGGGDTEYFLCTTVFTYAEVEEVRGWVAGVRGFTGVFVIDLSGYTKPPGGAPPPEVHAYDYVIILPRAREDAGVRRRFAALEHVLLCRSEENQALLLSREGGLQAAYNVPGAALADDHAPGASIYKPVQLTDELCAFLGEPAGTELSRVEVTRRLNAYITARPDLQDPADRCVIRADAGLRGIIKPLAAGEKLTHNNVMARIGHHIGAPTPTLSVLTARPLAAALLA